MAGKIENKAQNLVNHFSSLVAYTEKLAFPNHREGILSPYDTARWGRLRKTLHRITHAALSIDNAGLLNIVFYLLWAYGAVLGLAEGVVFIQPNLYGLVIPGVQPHTVADNPIILTIAVVLVVTMLPVAIYWWYEVVTDIRYAIYLKIVFVLIFFGSTYAFSRQLKLDAPISAWLDPRSGLLVSFLLYFCPAITYLMIISLDLIIEGIYLILVIFGGIKSLHNPLPFSEIRKLLQEELPSEDSKKPWQLLRSSKGEIQAIHKWAIANREASEKRTIPVSIGLAILGLLAVSAVIRTKIDTLLADVWNALRSIITGSFSLPLITTVFDMGLFLVLVALIMSVTIGLIRLFVNLAVQNIIIEACVVAQFGKEK